jgi:hypothetical protein
MTDNKKSLPVADALADMFISKPKSSKLINEETIDNMDLETLKKVAAILDKI